VKSSLGVCGLISDRADRAIQTGLARASLLLYSRHMPTQVVVLKRSRRSLFAAPRALPDWLRSVWAALFRTPAIVDPAGSTSPWAKDSPLFPELVRDANGSHRCVGCDLCVRVCPSRCLLLGTEGEGAGLRVTRFELVRGACIGCGICAEACPESAIEMTPAARVEIALISGGPDLSDLLSAKD
jgi:ferredoxin